MDGTVQEEIVIIHLIELRYVMMVLLLSVSNEKMEIQLIITDAQIHVKSMQAGVVL